MLSWTSGYVSDIPYSAGFYRELAPTHFRFAALALGAVPGEQRRYLELGSGQGFGLALLAAAEPGVRFHGVDFNPEHIVTSRRIADGAGLTNVTFEEASFEEIAARPEAEPYDQVAMHGILSWVSRQAQEALVAILSRRLSPGGLAYVSYNCLPGWAAMAPFQHMMRALAARVPAGRSDMRVEQALKALGAMKDGGSRYFSANPGLAPRMEKMPGMNRAYLAHEYLNQHWHPLYFSDVAAMLEPAKLGYLGSATLSENIDAIAVPQALQAGVAEAGADTLWRETLRDYAANKQFRRDLFARGLPAANGAEHGRALGETGFVLAKAPAEITYKFQGPLGEIEAHKDLYEPLVERLAGAEIATFREIAALPAFAGKGSAAALQALTLLVHSGQVLPAAAGDRAEARKTSRAFNRFVVSSFEAGRPYGFLASPVAGTGFAAGTGDLLALSAIQAGRTDRASLSRHVLDTLGRLGQRPIREGKAIADDGQALEQIEREIAPIVTSKLAVWKRLGIV